MSSAANKPPLGLWTAIALVVGSMIGSGVFVLPATLAPYGASSLLGWSLTLGGALLLALVYAWLARSITSNGGAYCYVRSAYGDAPGFLVAWSYWICNWTGNAALAVIFAGSIGAIWPEAVSTPVRGASVALGALWFCTAVNIAGLREAGRMQMLATILKVVPLVLFGIVGIAYVDTSNYQPFNPSGQPLGNVTLAVAAVTLWAFLGLEAATVPSAAIRDAERNVPRATVIGMLIAGFATILTCTVVLGLLPGADLAKSAAPMADAATRLWGGWAGQAVGVVQAVSVFGALNGWILLQAQTPLSAARDGLFPRAFAAVDANGTPWLGLLISSGLATALVAANYSRSLVSLYNHAMLMSVATALLPYAATALAWWKLNPRSRFWHKLVAIGAFAYSLGALWGAGEEYLVWCGYALLAGLPVYFWQRRALAATAVP